MSSAAWSALADRFDAIARRADYQLALHTHRPLWNGRPSPAWRIWAENSAHATTGYGYWIVEELEPKPHNFISFNGFLWLCWAAGRLACPDAAQPELSWLILASEGKYPSRPTRPAPSVVVPGLLPACSVLARRLAAAKASLPRSPAPEDGAWRLQFESLREAFNTRSVGWLDLNYELTACDYESPEFVAGENRQTESHNLHDRLRMRAKESERPYDSTSGLDAEAWGEREPHRVFIDLATHAARAWPARLRPSVPLLPIRWTSTSGRTSPLAAWLDLLWLACPDNFNLCVYPMHREWLYAKWQGGNPFLASVLAIDRFIRGYSADTAFDLDQQAVSQVPWFTLEDRAAALAAVSAAHGRPVVQAGAGFLGVENLDSPRRTDDNSGSLEQLPRCQQLAYSQYSHASRESGLGPTATNLELYNWLKGRLEKGEKIPAFDTWERYVRTGQRACGTGKNSRRAERIVGRSVVRANEVQ